MPNAFTLPLIAGLAIVGAAAGVQLGRSAVAEINPAYLGQPDTPFYADLAANRGPDWSAVQAQEYQREQVVTQDAPVPAACVGCRTWPVEYVPRPDPTVDRLYGSAANDREYRDAVARVPVAVVYQAPDPARERIVRYASYPVSREEAERAQQRTDAGSDAAPAEDDAATQ